MNPKQEAELEFWRELVKQEGPEGFIRRRRADFYRHMNNFNGWADLSGLGLEIGTGCYSMLEWCNGSVMAVDPLASEFKSISPTVNRKVAIYNMDGEELPEESFPFEWVVCWNVIDHTPNPDKMVSEIFRVLKPGGKLYLEVNFDDELAKPHYSLWNEGTVEQYFGQYRKLYENKIRNEEDHQWLYYAVFEK